jgi:transcriptional regulator with XRE-family HTH domain
VVAGRAARCYHQAMTLGQPTAASFDREGFYHEVGVRLRHVRTRRELTQDEVARALGVPRATYANIERGRQRVAVDFIWKAAVVLGVPIDRLVPEPLSGPATATDSEKAFAVSGTGASPIPLPSQFTGIK